MLRVHAVVALAAQNLSLVALARRGRAETVCALSPERVLVARKWSAGGARNRVERNAAMSRLTRSLTPLVKKSAALRRRVMRDAAWRGDRVSVARGVEIVNDALGCTILDTDV